MHPSIFHWCRNSIFLKTILLQKQNMVSQSIGIPLVMIQNISITCREDVNKSHSYKLLTVSAAGSKDAGEVIPS